MSVWSNSDSANAAPIFPGVAGVNNANGSQMFGNTQIAAFNTGLRETSRGWVEAPAARPKI